MKSRVVLVLVIAALFLVVAPLAAAQQQPTTAMAPPQIRRVEPPPADATAAQLEQRGDELRTEKAYVDAIDYYRAALRKEPKSAVLHNKTGIAELQLARYREAKKDFERATKLKNDYAEAYNNLGVVYYIDRDYKKAIKIYQKALALQEATASFHSNLGTAYFERKEIDLAMKEYLRALELDPDIFERLSMAGVTAHLASPSDRAHYSYILAKMYAQAGNSDRCLLYLRRAKEDGYDKLSDVYKDDVFAQIRKDPRFAELMGEKTTVIPQ
ncbi:MAG TPA: tetratricopeptide repeat protein [Terriglobales bacterium]|nr:tetratricopeptide repeat protein [Terriglobales bacterium]